MPGCDVLSVYERVPGRALDGPDTNFVGVTPLRKLLSVHGSFVVSHAD